LYVIARKQPDAKQTLFGIDAKPKGNELMNFRHRSILRRLMYLNHGAAISFYAISGHGEATTPTIDALSAFANWISGWAVS